MRVYLPATLSVLLGLNEDGRFAPLGGTGFALTPALRESFLAGDDEELSEVALREAARASLRLLGAEERADATQGAPEQDTPDQDRAHTPELPARRVVVAAEIADALVTLRPDLDAAVVKVSGPVEISDVVAVHVDAADAEPAVIRAVELVDDADLGDEDAELAIGDVEDFDLAWYATQELPFLLELL